MKYKVLLVLWMAMNLILASDCLAQDPPPLSAESSTVPSAEKAPISVEGVKKKFHLEIGGNYSILSSDIDTWKSIDLKLMYSGWAHIVPFGSVSSLSRKEGSQRVYGIGSYINVSPEFYMIAGVSGAPVADSNVAYYPKLRLDLTGFIKAPILDGLVMTTGFSDLSMEGGGGVSIISIGGIYYYRKFIFNLSLNYNISRPGSETSQSVQAGAMYGTQGKYFIGGGGATGKVAYQSTSAVPFDVRYDSRGLYAFYQHWMGKNWGIIGRYDYQDLVGSYNLNGITMTLFIDF